MFQQYLKSAKKEPSAIDRFFWSRGVKLMGYNNLGWALGGYITGGIHAVLGIIFTSLISVGFPALVGPVFLSFGIILLYCHLLFPEAEKRKTGTGSQTLGASKKTSCPNWSTHRLVRPNPK